MPIYEYTCRACGKLFEHWHPSMTDAAPVACPDCAATDVQRRISTPSIRTGGAAASAPGGHGEQASPAKPEVFGRKELNAALAARGQKPAKE